MLKILEKNKGLQVLDLEANEIKNMDNLGALSQNRKMEQINLKDNPISSANSFSELCQKLKALLPKIQLVNEQDLSAPLKKEQFKKKLPNAANRKEVAKKNLKESCKNFQEMLAMPDEEIDNFIKSVVDDGPDQAIPEDEIDDYDL